MGRLTWYKRVDLAVQACTRLNKRLVVIGGGESWTSSGPWPGRPSSSRAAVCPTKKCAATTCARRASFSRVKRTLASPRRGPERGHAGAGLWPRRRVRERAARQDRLLV
ncbi:hypothetical protein NIA69_10560 [Gemmiger formicilis]|nr:hypothetical protein [Gemmiger formicilis]